jgi:hypothetical protein
MDERIGRTERKKENKGSSQKIDMLLHPKGGITKTFSVYE